MINYKYIIIIIALIIYTLIIQYRYLAYFVPNKIIRYTPSDFNMDFQEVNIGKINGWFFPNTNNTNKSNDHIILYYHGNAGNISNRIGIIKQLLTIFPNNDFFIFDYPQFGISRGDLIPSNIISSSYKVYNYWALKYKNISLLGESIGAGIIAEVFSLLIKLNYQNMPKNIIHLNGVTCLKDIVGNIIPFIIKPFILPWIDEFNSEKIYIKHITKLPNLIIIHTPNDDIVPIKFVDKFMHKLRICKSIKFIKIDGSHNNPIIDNDAINLIKSTYIS
jgi:hypothetical protein